MMGDVEGRQGKANGGYSMKRRALFRLGALVACLAVLSFSFAVPETAGAIRALNARVTWDPQPLRLAMAEPITVPVQFQVSRPVESLTFVAMSPRVLRLEPSPRGFTDLKPGKTYTINLKVTLPAARHGGRPVSATLIARAGQSTLASPLTIRVTPIVCVAVAGQACSHQL